MYKPFERSSCRCINRLSWVKALHSTVKTTAVPPDRTIRVLYLALHCLIWIAAPPRIVSVAPSISPTPAASQVGAVEATIQHMEVVETIESEAPASEKEVELQKQETSEDAKQPENKQETKDTEEPPAEQSPKDAEEKKTDESAEAKTETGVSKPILLRPFAQLAGLAEADTPMRPVFLLGEEIRDIDAFNLTVDFLDIMLGPIREANLLLPKRLDPFSQDQPQPLLPKIRRDEEKEFKPSEQRRLLGSQLATRDDTPDSTAKWHWSVSAGGSFRQGNTSNTNIHSQFQANRRSNKSVLTAKTGMNYNRNGEDNPNRRATGEIVIDRNMRGRWIWYGREEAEYDQARFIDLRNIASTGLGFKFVDELNRRLVARTGPTISHMIYAPGANNEDETRSGWLLESEYRQLIGDTIRIEWTTSAFPNFDNEQQFRVRSDAALLFPIGKSSAWSWKLGLRHDYQLDPVGETRSTDVEGYFSITYAK